LAPVASPAFLSGHPPQLSPDAIAALPYAISPGARLDWRNWCRTQGLENPARPAPLELENRAMVLDYLMSGGGIGLADMLFASRELDSGQLVRLHPDTIAGVNGIYLVWPKTPMPDPKIIAFGEWLSAEIETIDVSTRGTRDP
jgi:DNA-binding transcriptional LysR family regulator